MGRILVSQSVLAKERERWVGLGETIPFTNLAVDGLGWELDQVKCTL